MSGFRVLLLLVIALTIATAREKPNKSTGLITNHLRAVNPEFDDAEYMKFEASANGKTIAKNANKKEIKARASDDDKPKTLSQQIADGKYGLIHKELFSKPPKRPNVISYDFNPEVPNDTINNLGGLDKNEIWLAENHLLVLRGGSFPPHDDKQDNNESPWAPLDNFKAPLHQVKIPKNPKVPPPFPVQLTENGPLQILGTNFTRTINGTYQDALDSIPPPEGYPPFDAPFLPQPYHTDPTNATARPVALPIPVDPSGEYPAGVPFPPALLNGTLPPSLSYLPPGTVVLPPPGNQTDYSDYDDPSIYYPPPYSFFYPKDNASAVPAGPLVPGIVLPPPPDFFAPLEDVPTPTRKPMRNRKPTTTQLTVIKTTSTTKKPITQKTVKIYPVKNHQYIKEIKQTTTTTIAPQKSVTILPEVFTVPPPARKKPGITVLRPVTPPKVYIYDNEIPNKPFKHYGPPPVTTTQIPLRYHTTAHDIETNSVDQQQSNLRKPKYARTTVKPVQYYFYEEPERSNRRPKTNHYPDNNEPYYVRPKPIVPSRQKRPQYVYVTARPYNTQKPRFRFIQQAVHPDSFNIHINKLQQQIHKYYTTSPPAYRAVPKPVYQFSFQANNFRHRPDDLSPPVQRAPEKYTVEIQQAIELTPPSETPKYHNDPVYYQHTTQRPYYSSSPKYQRQNVATPRPISEYSFEATPNPVYQGYYTKPDESYFDDRTKTYFTMFGRKLQLPGGGTTPLPRGASLEDDTLVNYANPRPGVDPDAEIIPVKDRPSYPNVVRYPPDNAEVVKAIPVEVPSKESHDGSFISYQLPGDDGAHFYFLTPQLAQRRDQGVGYFYSKARRRRNEKTADVDR
ncbi:unnamed protein product [Phyllotreta striolata]|uniref:Uncharacterized protein n=1 Tax=Phyllotreta striolata TaxID=444603 RepID=A0A9N9TM77_PHYSR|nr:unnamed protein product [Phyllotreta striolata]